MLGQRFGEHVRRFRPAYVALLLSLMMTAASALVLRRSAQKQEQLWLSALAHEVSDRARSRVEQYLGFLRGVRGLFVASVGVEPEEFGEYVTAMQLHQLPALSAAVYAASAEGAVTITYVEPKERRSELLAIELMVDPGTRWALQQAERASGPIASTGTVFWIFLHIPRSARSQSVPKLGAKLPGFAGVQLRSDVLWHELVSGPKRAMIGYQLRGVAASGAVYVFYEEGQLDRAGTTIETTIRLEIAGGAWTLRLVANRNAVDSMWWLPWLIAIVGAFGSGMLFSLMCVQIAARRSAEHLTELRDEFLSAAAHELKTPVTAIKGFSQLLLGWDLEQVQRRSDAALKSIDRQADRINRLVQDMLEASRLQRHCLTLTREPIDLVAVVRSVTEDLRASFPNHQLVVTSEGGATVFADLSRIEQVVTNLLSNAAKYSSAGGEILVHVREIGDELVTSVQDFGIGIPAERQRDLFERYSLAHRGTPYEAIGGLGLGLYISKEIVIRHGGRIWFESEEGKGATFSFSLPVSRGRPDDTARTDRR